MFLQLTTLEYVVQMFGNSRLFDTEKQCDLLLDEDVYHIGASIKDVGKRWFAIMKMVETKADEIIRHLETHCHPSL